MATATKSPRLSANKLGEYMAVGPARRRKIIYDAKFPSDAVRPFYTPAEEAISLFIAGGLADISILENRIKVLGQSHAKSVWEQRRINGNIDAIETFMNMLDAIDLKGAKPELGSGKPPLIAMNGVGISVRPEIVLVGASIKGQPTVGGMKLHFPKSNPLSSEAAAYVSTIVHNYTNDHLSNRGLADGKLCIVVDVASGKVYPGPASTKQRTKDLGAATQEIAAAWPNIAP